MSRLFGDLLNDRAVGTSFYLYKTYLELKCDKHSHQPKKVLYCLFLTDFFGVDERPLKTLLESAIRELIHFNVLADSS